MTKKIIIPTRYIVVHPQKSTRATHDKHGMFTGRVVVQGLGDRTKERFVKKDVDVNHDGKIDFHGGQLIGRTRVRASGRARAHTREL